MKEELVCSDGIKLAEKEIRKFDNRLIQLLCEYECLMERANEVYTKMAANRKEKLRELLRARGYYPLREFLKFTGMDIKHITFLLESGTEKEYHDYIGLAQVTEDGHFSYSSESGIINWDYKEECYCLWRYGLREKLPIVGIVSVEFMAEDAEDDDE